MATGFKVTDEKIIEAVLSSDTQIEAAQMLKITPQTLSKRIHQPKLKEKLSEYRKDILDKTSNQLIKSNLKATETLTQLLDSESELTRYNSASKVLQLSKDYIALSDISARLDRLENDFKKQ